MLAGDVGSNWSWFESFDDVPRIQPADLQASVSSAPQEMGPHDLIASEWIVQLSEVALGSNTSLESLNELLDVGSVDFSAIAGLGAPGSALLRARGVSVADIQAALGESEVVESFHSNSLIEGQRTTPNEPDFQAGLLPGLGTSDGAGLIDAPTAWDETQGSVSTVVGVIDGGIDATHPDLFLNVWLNQGEIPPELNEQLVDIDADGLITFYDLNNLRVVDSDIYVASTVTFDGSGVLTGGDLATVSQMTTATPFASGPNAAFVSDINANGRIDAIDLLDDVRWADGRDTDGNTFFDDFFGVNFRAGADDPFQSNRPLDQRGHGTHVAGTVGAVGNNGFGSVGVNWQSSLMALRILNNENQSDAAAAIRAINYAKQMRSDFRTDDNDRVVGGANVRVLNNSWGQPGGFEQAFETAIQDLGDEGVLFVAASGNGNILGNGVDNDQTPFFPASYDADNVIAVAALSADGNRLATFSNFGATSVDLAAPGVGVRSTLPGGAIGPANGTSMAAPHVSGTAALIWTAFPAATVAEVKQAILSTVTPVTGLTSSVSTGGRLNAGAAINANVFAPAATLIAKNDITTAGGTETEFTIEYSHRSGIDPNSIGDDDLIVTRQWGPADQITPTLKPGSVVQDGTSVTATYVVAAPGGDWDPLDFGDYKIETAAGGVAATSGDIVQSREVGAFRVQVEDPSFLYVDSNRDLSDSGSLRDAITIANAAGAPRTIILDSGTFAIEVVGIADPSSNFPVPDPNSYCNGGTHEFGFSNEMTGDFDVTGSITIIGSQSEHTIIDGNQIDRVFKVHPGGALNLERLTVSGGVSPADQGGGGILSAGTLNLQETIVRNNRASGADGQPIRGGGIAAWAGTANISGSWITENSSDFGGGVFYCGVADGTITRSTVSGNAGGGLHSHSDSDLFVDNSTFSGNVGGRGAIFHGKRDGFNPESVSIDSRDVRFSANGQFLTFVSHTPNLVANDSDSDQDIFVMNRQTKQIEQITLDFLGTIVRNPVLSADGRFIAFEAGAEQGASERALDVYVFDRATNQLDLVSVNDVGERANGRFEPSSNGLSISADGRFVAYVSTATNLDSRASVGQLLVYVFDRLTDTVELVSVDNSGAPANNISLNPQLSADGKVVAFASAASNLHADGMPTSPGAFAYDRDTRMVSTIAPSSSDELGGISTDGRFVALSDASIFDRLNSNQESEPDVPVRFNASLSANGQFVAFDTNLSEVFVYDRVTDTTEQINVEGGTRPNISGDGRYVTTSSSDNLFVYDRTTDTSDTLLTFEQGVSTLFASQVTVAFTSDSTAAVTGNVDIRDSLLTENEGLRDVEGTVDLSSVGSLSSSDAGSNLIGPLVRADSIAPVHPLRSGNPAIDSGNVASAGTLDQVGMLRDNLPDIGAVETGLAAVSGSVFVDRNANRVRDLGEPGIEGISVTSNVAGDQITVSGIDDPRTVGVDETGAFSLRDLPSGVADINVVVPPNFSFSAPEIRVAAPFGFRLDGNVLGSPSISADSQVIAFDSEDSTNLPTAPPSRVGSQIYLYDLGSDSIENLSLPKHAGGPDMLGSFTQFKLSPDGRSLVFESTLSNLVPGHDSQSSPNVFLYHRDTDTVTLVSNTSEEAGSGSATFSGDGRFLAFSSAASDLVPADTNGAEDLFVYSIADASLERVEVGGSTRPRISGDGRFVVFSTNVDNLVAGDTNGSSDSFLFDRTLQTLQLLSVAPTGVDVVPNLTFSREPVISADGQWITSVGAYIDQNTGDQFDGVLLHDRINGTVTEIVRSFSIGVSNISDDGRFVGFLSLSDDLVAGDNNNTQDSFIYDRQLNTIVRTSVDRNGVEANGMTTFEVFSSDGRFQLVTSLATNLVNNDDVGNFELFLAPNPLADPGFSRVVKRGNALTGIDLGLIPDPGSLSGTLFEDTIENSVLDVGETLLTDWTVYLDTNNNRLLDGDERSTSTDPQGRYSFPNTSTLASYTIAVQPPSGWQQIAPGQPDGFAHSVFLPAGGNISGRDFAFRRVTGTAQSRDSAVSGRVYDDKNGNGVFDAGDVPRAGTTVFLDTSNFGVRDVNEPAVATAADGSYTIADLGASVVAVSTILDDQTIQVSPLGSDFELNTSRLFESIPPFANPQAIASADFNGDTFPDLAVVLGEANQVSIRLNDGHGGFPAIGADSPQEINIDLGADGGGPVSMVVGQFNGAGTPLDIAVANNFSGNVTVLLDFDGADFVSKVSIPVGDEPLDIAAAAFSGDSDHLDLVIVNKADSTVQVLQNDGSGVFTAQPAIPSGGTTPVSLVTGQFDDDGITDVAVLHIDPVAGTTSGNVRVLTGSSDGTLSLTSDRFEVGAGPVEMIVGDFNNDSQPDLAVANFASNSVSVLTGNSDGSFVVESTTLGTASGALDLAAGDIDGDGDTDIVASNLRDRNVAIFRNITPTIGGTTAFEPLEAVGLGQFSFARRMPLVLDDFDQRISDRSGAGTLDVATIPVDSDPKLNVLLNSLVDGTRRVQLTGTNQVEGLDFIISPASIAPTLDPITSPAPIVEDSDEQSVTLTGIAKGRAGTVPLQFNATSSNPALVSNPQVTHIDGASEASVLFTPTADVNGQATITVTVIDAGADQVAGTSDDVSASRQFVVNVLPVNDAPKFTNASSLDVLEDAGLTSLDFLTGITRGGTDESTQLLNPFVVTTDNSKFATPPQIDSSGRLTFTTAANFTGPVTVNVSLSDNGGTANGGVNESSSAFVINVLPVNDAPTISLGSDLVVQSNAGEQVLAGFATGFAPGGGADEGTQVISDFLVTVDDPGIFVVGPDISSDGSLTFTAADDRAGIATVTVQVRDSGGQANGGADLSVADSFTIETTPVPDTTRPNPVLSTTVTELTNSTTFAVDVDFGEVVNGFTLDDVAVSSGTLSDLENLTGGRFRFTFNGSDGPVTFDLAADLATDAAGNGNLAAATLTRTIDSEGVSTSLSSTSASVSNLSAFPLSISFSEPVGGFTLSDITVLGGTASDLVVADAAAGSFTATITPAADGTVTVLIAAGVAQDAAGNENIAGTALVRTVDRVAPVAVLTTNEPSLTNKTSFDVFADFGEPVVGLTLSDLSITGGTASEPVLVAPGRFQFSVTAANGPVQMQLVAGATEDAAGNATDESNSLAVNVDTSSFVPELTSASDSILNDGTFEVAVDFGKAVASFTSEDLILINGIASNITDVDVASGRYSFTVTAITDGQVTVLIASGLVEDDAGNGNSASNTLLRTIDRVAPIPSLSVNVAALTNQTNFVLTVDFGKEVTGLEASDLAVSGVTLSNLQSLGAGRFTMNAAASDGTVTIRLPADVANDLAGNANAASELIELTVDSSRAVPTLSSTPGSEPGTFDLLIVFDKNVSGLTLNDFQLFNATMAALDGSGDRYTATLAAVNVGDLMVSLPEERVVDAVGNQNVESNELGLTFQGSDSIVLESADELVDMTALDANVLSSLTLIDIRGTGDNSLVLDAARIAQLTPDQTLVVFADPGDQVSFGTGWQFDSVEVVEGAFRRVFTNGDATVRLVGPLSWTNPITPADVNANGSSTAADALAIINALGPRQVVTADGTLVDPATIDASLFKFFDTNADGKMSASDALFVVNRISNDGQEREGELIAKLPEPLEHKRESILGDSVAISNLDAPVVIASYEPTISTSAVIRESSSYTTTKREPSRDASSLTEDLVDAAMKEAFLV